MKSFADILIIGAGPSGLATAYHLQKAGLDFLILEKGDRPGFSYSQMHDSLTLLTPACYSNLPGLKLSKNTFAYYNKNQLSDYYQNYAKHFNLPIQFNTKVQAVQKKGGEFEVKTNQGTLNSKFIVSASGVFSHPFIPPIKGRGEATIPIIHSSEYRNLNSVENKKRVLVVGAGNTGVEIATDLAEAGHEVVLSSKRPPKILPHRILGVDVHFFSRPVELVSRLVARTLKKPIGIHRTPVLGRKVVGFIRQKKIKLSSALEGVEGNIAKFKGGSASFDAIILATGYRYQTPYLKGLEADARIFYVGKPGHGGIDSSYLRGINLDAKRVAKSLKKRL